MTTTPTPPDGPHADLIARLREQIEEYGEGRSEYHHDDPLPLTLRYAIAALSDSVPREQYVRTVDERAAWEHLAHKAERERDEALAERDALVAQLDEVDAVVGDPEHPRFSQPEVRARMHAIVEAATANEGERDRILVRIQAEAGAQAVEAASHALWVEHGGPVRRSLREYAEALREGAGS